MLWSQQTEDIDRNRNIEKEIIDVFIVCGRQNIAIRGVIEDKNARLQIYRTR
jgi:predicted acetyltransferase